MNCSKCGQDNRLDARFCDSCGNSLLVICASCDKELRPDAKFCDACGFRVGDGSGTDVNVVLETQSDTEPVIPQGNELPTAVAEISSSPTSFSSGRYEVLKFLGEGGKKKVYLAHDTMLDREVAFALIKTEGLDDIGRARVNREAQAMGRLGSHPHIVTVFDLGEENDQPFMVTELMGGGDVEGLVEDASENRIQISQAMQIAVAVCRGLEFAHSRNIVHRDLKPGNVWLTSDGIAKIGDFGLAVATDRSRLTQHGMMVGTVSYMPPEQAMGGEVTVKADIYSLGAMLYEMVTGRPPFLGDDAVSIIGQHINTPAVAPTWHNGLCPRPLEALIMRMLAKDPGERPESASDVLSALEAMETSNLTESVVLEDTSRTLDSVSSGVFVGRQKEMDELKAALEDALSGHGRMVTLVGEPGIGKTRTSQELATYANLRNAQVLWGRCYEEQGVPPYWPWVQAIRSYVREKDPQELSAEMGSGASEIAEIVSDVRERLPGLSPATTLEPEQARFRLFDSISAFLKSASLKQPLVLVLDDLHWSDKPSLMLLQFVARELSGCRLLLVGTYRDMELSRQHPLAESLGELTRERMFQRVLLRGLTGEDVGRFIEVATGISPPEGLINAVHTQTEGNPLFVTEVVRLLVQEGDLTADKSVGRNSWTVRIPEGVREVIGRRLNRLSERCNEALTIASVLGREFRFEQIKGLVEETSDERLLDILDEALASKVIEEMPQSVGQYQFTHALMQETLTEEISLTRRVRLHSRIAVVLEELYGLDAASHAAELAHHYAQAEAVLGSNKLIEYSLIAGDRALSNYAFEEAVEYFELGLTAKGISLQGTEKALDAQSAELLLGLGRAMAGTTLRQQEMEVSRTLKRAFDYYVEVGDSSTAVAIASSGQGSHGNDLIATSLDLVNPESYEAGKLLSRYILPLREDYDAAQDAFERAITIANREVDLDLEMATLVNGACVSFSHHRYEESLERNQRAIELARKVNQPIHESHSRYDLMHVLYGLGDLPGATEHAKAMIPVAERSGNLRWRGSAIEINENIASVQGDWKTAREWADRGLAIAPGDPNLLGSRALVEYQTGDFEAGSHYLDRLQEIADAVNLDYARETTIGGHRIQVPAWYTYAAIAIPLATRITGIIERFETVEKITKTIVELGAVVPAVTRSSKIAMGLVAVQLSDKAKAAEVYPDIEIRRGTLAPTSPHGPGLSTDRLLALLAQEMGDVGTARKHFEDSISFCKKAGYRPELAWAYSDYADLLRNQQGPEDLTKAIGLLDEALTITQELSMRPLMEKVLGRRDILKA